MTLNVKSTSSSTISSVDIYTSVNGGDAIVHLTSNSLSGSCPYGFWISGTDAGAKSVLAQMIAAHSVGGSVIIAANINSTWSGNTSTARTTTTILANTGLRISDPDIARTISNRDRSRAVLLCGGDKHTQDADIKSALGMAEQWRK